MGDVSIDHYISNIQRELDEEPFGESFLDVQTRVRVDPKEVSTGIELLATVMGLTAGTMVGYPTVQRYIQIETDGGLNFRYYFQHTPWNHSKVKAAIANFKRDVVKGQDGLFLLYTERTKKGSRKVRCFLEGYENKEGNIVKFNGNGNF